MMRISTLLVCAALVGCATEPPPPPNLAGDWFAGFENVGVGCRSEGPLTMTQSGATLEGVWMWHSQCLTVDTTVVLPLHGDIVGDSVRFTSEAGDWTATILSANELEYVDSTGTTWRATR